MMLPHKSTSRSNVPIVARVARDHALTRRLAWVPAGIVLLGAIGAVAQVYSAAAIPAHPSSASGPAAHLPR
jgi:hypothetical protein